MKIALIDDHEAILIAAESVLTTQFEAVCYKFQGFDDFVAAQNINSFDLVLLDVVMEEQVGLTRFKMCKNLYPNLPVIAFTSLKNQTLIQALIKIGIEGYVCKTDGMAELIQCADAVMKGKKHYPAAFDSFLSRFAQNESVWLSPREIEVVQLLYQGKTSHEIAELLFVSHSTIETHRKNLFNKFEVNNLASLLKKCIDIGYIS